VFKNSVKVKTEKQKIELKENENCENENIESRESDNHKDISEKLKFKQRELIIYTRRKNNKNYTYRGVVLKKLSNTVYVIQIDNMGRVKAHINQLKKCILNKTFVSSANKKNELNNDEQCDTEIIEDNIKSSYSTEDSFEVCETNTPVENKVFISDENVTKSSGKRKRSSRKRSQKKQSEKSSSTPSDTIETPTSSKENTQDVTETRRTTRVRQPRKLYQYDTSAK
jgi:hypothetical protein